MKKLLFVTAILGMGFTNGFSQTWTTQISNTAEDLNSIVFIDSCTGWTFGTAGAILKTTSGGGSWGPLNTLPVLDIFSGHFFNAANGIGVGEHAITGVGAKITTTDGGLTWNIDTLTFPGALFDIFFANNATGWVVGIDGYVAKTINGGTAFTPQNSGLGAGDDLFSIFFADASNGWAVGAGGIIINTNNGGTTPWTAQTSGTIEDLNSVFFLNSLKGWAVGFGGVIVSTTDGGTIWADTIINPGIDFFDVVFLDDSTGWVVGSAIAGAGTVLMTTDGGATWTSQISGTIQDIFSITMLSSTLGWYSGTTGAIGHYGLVPAPSADFAFSAACLGDTNFFTDSSLGTPTSWLWDFGDFTTSTLQNPLHAYIASGTYTVTLTISNATGCSDIAVKIVNIPPGIPVANFTAAPVTVCAGSPVNFTDTSTGSPTTWLWNFGDGGGGNVQNPAYTYLIPGTYDVTLTVTNGCGTDIDLKVAFITVTANTLNANFVFDTACFGYPTTFTDLSTGTTTTWVWDFNDGGFPVDSSQNTSHTFSGPGTYNVDLTISDGACLSFISQLVLVNPLPNASFTNTTACANDSTFFSDASGGGPVSWLWDFGDVSPLDSNQNPAHAYAVGGNYNATLIVTNIEGCNDTIVNVVTVDSLPIVLVTPSAPVICAAGNPVTLAASGAVTYSWTPAAGLSATVGDTVIASPAATTTYTVFGTDINGCADSANVTVTLDSTSAAVANFNAVTTTVCAGSSITFNNTSTGAVGYGWSLPGTIPDTSNMAMPTVIYDSAGTFDVTLTAYGCVADSTVTLVGYITVTSVPIANITATGPTSVCGGDTVELVSGPATNYNWLLNGVATGVITINYFAISSGDYQVVVSNAGGCADTSAIVTVIVSPDVTGILFANDNGAIVSALGGTGGFTYLWNPGGFTTAMITGVAPGTYSVTVTDAIGCTWTGSIFVGPTGLNELTNENSNIIFYPNPANDVLNIETKGTNMLSITMINALGQVVSYITPHDNHVQISTADYVNGFYFILIETNDGLIRGKISVNK